MAKIPVTDCPAGPVLDAAVARVLGWERYPGEYVDHWIPPGFDLPVVRDWSDDIAAAWELAEKGNISLVRVKNKGWIALPDSDYLDESELWEMNDGSLSGYFERRLSSVVIAPAPLAITRAFLLAHGVTEVEAADD